MLIINENGNLTSIRPVKRDVVDIMGHHFLQKLLDKTGNIKVLIDKGLGEYLNYTIDGIDNAKPLSKIIETKLIEKLGNGQSGIIDIASKHSSHHIKQLVIKDKELLKAAITEKTIQVSFNDDDEPFEDIYNKIMQISISSDEPVDKVEEDNYNNTPYIVDNNNNYIVDNPVPSASNVVDNNYNNTPYIVDNNSNNYNNNNNNGVPALHASNVVDNNGNFIDLAGDNNDFNSVEEI